MKAYVSRKPDAAVTGEELIRFCQEQMAAYTYPYPRSVEFLDDLPEQTGGRRGQ